jgi:hypothetical protein
VSKDKKKKKKDKKEKNDGATLTVAQKLDALTQNPVVAEVVSAALVAMASALKDSRKARQLASEAGDEIAKLTKEGAERGNVLWDMALQVGRRSLETLAAEQPKRAKAKPASKKSPPKKRQSARGARGSREARV